MKKKEHFENSPKLKYFFGAIFVLLLLLLNYTNYVKNVSSNDALVRNFTQEAENPVENYRNPAVAGAFYPKDGHKLQTEVNHYMANAAQTYSHTPKILIVPHAGYAYSASGAAKAYSLIAGKGDEIKTIFILGPAHTKAINGAALSAVDAFLTPLGKMELDKDVVEALAKDDIFFFDEEAHKKEHSIEVQLPFLQQAAPGAKIVPIVYGKIDSQKLADTLEPFLLDNTLLVISADLSHYYDYAAALQADAITAEKIQNKEPDIKSHESCGAEGINTGIMLAKKKGLVPTTLALFNSADAGGDKSRVVGYGAWAFDEQDTKLEFEVESLQKYMDLYGEQLLDIAQKSLSEAVVAKKPYMPKRGKYADELFDKGASFVTLTKDGELRGCIGSFTSYRSVAADVAENAYSAAVRDARFEKLSMEELGDVKISISLLTGYELIGYKNEDDLLEKIIPNVDGLLIKDGRRQALFLPGVWQNFPDKKDFLNNLKLKAGFTPSFWSNSIKVYRFRTVEK